MEKGTIEGLMERWGLGPTQVSRVLGCTYAAVCKYRRSETGRPEQGLIALVFDTFWEVEASDGRKLVLFGLTEQTKCDTIEVIGLLSLWRGRDLVGEV